MSFVKIFPFLLFHPFEISLVQSGKETAENNTQYKQEMTLSCHQGVGLVQSKTRSVVPAMGFDLYCIEKTSELAL